MDFVRSNSSTLPDPKSPSYWSRCGLPRTYDTGHDDVCAHDGDSCDDCQVYRDWLASRPMED